MWGGGGICMSMYKIFSNVSFGAELRMIFPSYSSILRRSGFQLRCYCLAAEFPRHVNFWSAIDGWSSLNSDIQQPGCSDLRWPMPACYFMSVCQQKENKGFRVVLPDLSGRWGCPFFPPTKAKNPLIPKKLCWTQCQVPKLQRLDFSSCSSLPPFQSTSRRVLGPLTHTDSAWHNSPGSSPAVASSSIFCFAKLINK